MRRWVWSLAAIAAVAAAEPSGDGADNLDYWLERAQPDTQPTAPASSPSANAKTTGPFSRTDALDGAIELSDGRLLAGRLYTTASKDLEVYVEQQQRWRHVPLVIIRGIHAVVASEGIDPEWRWKEMGKAEKVYTGRSRPVRRLQWRVDLIDGTSLTGEIKGMPLWIERRGKREQFVLHARSKGQWGQSLDQLIYPAHIVFSQGEMRRIEALGDEGRIDGTGDES